jgi:hypothetical protein
MRPGNQKFDADLADAGVNFLQFLNLNLLRIVGGTGNELFDEVFAGVNRLQDLLREHALAVCAVIEQEIDDHSVTIDDCEEKRGAFTEIDISSVLDGFNCILEGAYGAGQLKGSICDSVAHCLFEMWRLTEDFSVSGE